MTPEPSQEWRRINAVMAVQQGQKTVEQAAQELGISRMHYYRLEERILAGALQAVRPRKRGPKQDPYDTALSEVRAQLAQSERERELQALKLSHLADANKL